jgi:hypothetical protein
MPASWNRYAYVYDNPVNYTDPSGMLGASMAGMLALQRALSALVFFDSITVMGKAYDLSAFYRFYFGDRPGFSGGSIDGGLDDDPVSTLDRVLSEIPIDGVEFGDCIEENRLDWGAITAYAIANPIANKLAGNTGRMGFGGVGPHPTTWQHKVGGAVSRATGNPTFGRIGKAAGRYSLFLTVFEGFYDIGTIARCAVVTG